eukprot:2234034-Rhodomonas_salina.4
MSILGSDFGLEGCAKARAGVMTLGGRAGCCDRWGAVTRAAANTVCWKEKHGVLIGGRREDALLVLITRCTEIVFLVFHFAVKVALPAVRELDSTRAVSYTHLRAHETEADL